jgi:hypothetical protein
LGGLLFLTFLSKNFIMHPPLHDLDVDSFFFVPILANGSAKVVINFVLTTT